MNADISKSEIDLQIFFDILPQNLVRIWCSRLLEKRDSKNKSRPLRVLLKFEPRVVLPVTYTSFVNDFDLIIDFGSRSKSALPWPQADESIRYHGFPEHGRESSVCMISANKTSLIRGELYSLRKQAALMNSEIVVYGRDWGSLTILHKILRLSKAFIFAIVSPKSIRFSSVMQWLALDPRAFGSPDSKFRTYSQYKFALVVENEASYVSEKLFDALASGCAPIYIGPAFGISPAIERLIFRAEPNIDSIRDAILRIKELDYSEWECRVREYFAGDEIRTHSYRNVAIEAARLISAEFSSRN